MISSPGRTLALAADSQAMNLHLKLQQERRSKNANLQRLIMFKFRSYTSTMLIEWYQWFFPVYKVP